MGMFLTLVCLKLVRNYNINFFLNKLKKVNICHSDSIYSFKERFYAFCAWDNKSFCLIITRTTGTGYY